MFLLCFVTLHYESFSVNPDPINTRVVCFAPIVMNLELNLVCHEAVLTRNCVVVQGSNKLLLDDIVRVELENGVF